MGKLAHPSPSESPTTATTPPVARHAVFDNCQNIIVNGGVFNVQASLNDSDQSDFRRVRLGDLKLLKEVAKQAIVEFRDVCHKRTGVVKRRDPEVIGVRRIHLAHVHGSNEDFTAVVYECSDFEKHRAHAEEREEFRHPSLVQLFGVTSSPRRKALIYHDGLMPLDEFRKIHEQSQLMSAYVEHELGKHFVAALDHWIDVTGEWLVVLDSYGFRARLETGAMLWIRISTGQLCIEVNDSEYQDPIEVPVAIRRHSVSGVHFISDTNFEEKLLSNMSLNDIHHMFSASSSGRWIESSEPDLILLGSLCWPTAGHAQLFNTFSEISLSYNLGFPDMSADRWEDADSSTQGSSFPNKGPVILPNGWTRVALSDLPIHEGCHFRKQIHLTLEARQEIYRIWLSQANHVIEKADLDADEFYLIYFLILHFSISSNLDEFTLQGTFMADSAPDDIYLFLFPTDVDDSNGNLAVHLPLEIEAYYWSFDPEGIERLPQDSLDKFTLPSVSFWAQVLAAHWSQEVYDSIADCHRAKGFDPASQDVAIELGYPLLDVDRVNDVISGGKIGVVDEVEGQERVD